MIHLAAYTIKNQSYIIVIMEIELGKNEMMDIFYRRSKEHGLEISPQRTTIYQELLKAKDHSSSENRTLLTFSQIGITNIVEGYGQPKRYDPDINTHHHFRCIQCNNIIDFHNKAYDNITVPREIQTQLTVLNEKVVLEGLCDKLSKKILKRRLSW